MAIIREAWDEVRPRTARAWVAAILVVVLVSSLWLGPVYLLWLGGAP